MQINTDVITQTRHVLFGFSGLYFYNRFVVPSLIPLEEKLEFKVISIMESVNQYPLQIAGMVVAGSFVYAVSSQSSNENDDSSISKRILREFTNGLLVSIGVVAFAQLTYFTASRRFSSQQLIYRANNPKLGAGISVFPLCVGLALLQDGNGADETNIVEEGENPEGIHFQG